MIRRIFRGAAVAVALILAGCSVPEIPDVTYFRLPPATPFPHA